MAADAHQTQSATAHDDLTGELLSGRYLVQECLGTGAMGAVYRAEHTLMKKTVAVKVLRPQLLERRDLVERFQREAQAAANIDHPNICSASDFGRMDDGAFFLVIEFLEGRTLEDELAASGALDPDRALHIAAQVASALGRAHELDIVHRDLKPENIMLIERDGDPDFVKILDFGVARVRLTEEHEESQLTKAGTVWGTPTYMSPEQAAGGEVDGRSDLYSLGVILYEMLAGRPPFEDDNPARVMAMHMTEEPPPLAGADANLSQMVERLLDKEPGRRPACADSLYDALTGGPLEAALPAAPQTSGRAEPLAERAGRAFDQLVEHAGPALDRALSWFRRQSLLTQGVTAGIGAALLLAMLVVPIVALTSAVGGPETDAERQEVERNLRAERAVFLTTAGLAHIVEAIEDNRTTDALRALDKVDPDLADNPHVAYLHGWVNGVRGRWQTSVEHYARALDAESLYAHDARLVEHVFERFSDHSDHRAAEARKIIEEHLDTAFANEKLAALATTAGRSEVRERALDVLQKTGRIDDLPEWRQLGIELRHDQDCDKRKQIIASIVDTDDPKALEVLEYFSERGRTGCGMLNLEDCYGCIRDDLKDAIDTLETRNR